MARFLGSMTYGSPTSNSRDSSGDNVLGGSYENHESPEYTKSKKKKICLFFLHDWILKLGNQEDVDNGDGIILLSYFDEKAWQCSKCGKWIFKKDEGKKTCPNKEDELWP